MSVETSLAVQPTVLTGYSDVARLPVPSVSSERSPPPSMSSVFSQMASAAILLWLPPQPLLHLRNPEVWVVSEDEGFSSMTHCSVIAECSSGDQLAIAALL